MPRETKTRSVFPENRRSLKHCLSEQVLPPSISLQSSNNIVLDSLFLFRSGRLFYSRKGVFFPFL